MPVYFVRAGDTDAVKIGYAVDVQARVAELQCGNHIALSVIAVREGDRGTEAWLHRRFSKRRLRGEWFCFDEAMLSVELPIGFPCAVAGPIAGLVDEWPSISEFAADAGVPYGVVQQWRRRNSIPGERWLAIVNAAANRGIVGVSLAVLAEIAKSRAEQAA